MQSFGMDFEEGVGRMALEDTSLLKEMADVDLQQINQQRSDQL